MRYKKSLLPLALCLLLAGCSKTQNVYKDGAYDTGDFMLNYYAEHDYAHDEAWKNKTIDTFTVYDDALGNKEHAYFGQNDYGHYSSHQSAKSFMPDVFGSLETAPIGDWTPESIGFDDTFINSSFGRTKCMAVQDPSFKEGVLSKLYNGQMYCDGWYSKARVQIDENGFSTRLPKTLSKGSYFMMSLRGGSNVNTNGATRLCIVDLRVDFYKGNEIYSVGLPGVALSTDGFGVGEMCSFVGFNMNDMTDFSLEGITGYGVSFSNYTDPDYAEVSSNKDDDKENHFGVMLYEVMFIDAEWK